MGTSARRASGSEHRFGLTLRGLRYLEHPKNAPELVGTLVPWNRVQIHRGGHAFSALILDEDGRPIGSGWRRTFWAVPLSQHAAVRWSIERWQRRTISEWLFDFREMDAERVQFRWMMGFMGLINATGLAMAISMAIPNLRGVSGGSAAVTIGSIIAACFMPAIMAMMAGATVYFVGGRAFANVKSAHVTPEHIEAVLTNGRVERVRWEDIRSIKRRAQNVYIVDATTGVRLRIWPTRTEFLFQHWMTQHGQSAPDFTNMRTLLIRVGAWCQVGGALGALLIWRLGIPTTRGPFAFYLIAGFALPLGLAFAASAERMLEFAATRASKSRRRSRTASTAAK